MNHSPHFFPLKNPCVVDVDTDVGQIALMMDKEYPQYIFVSIDGELRKCIDISDTELIQFESDRQVYDYLNYFQSSNAFQEIIDTEKEIDDGWDDL